MNIIERARQLRHRLEQFAETLTDNEGLEYVELFPQWITEHAYNVNDRVKFENVLYKCVQAHTSQADWTPDITQALWTRVSIDEFPEWIQPTGVQDAYKLNDKVSHNEKHWISLFNDNVWEPSVYGWGEIE